MSAPFTAWVDGVAIEATSLNHLSAAARILGYETVSRPDGGVGLKRPETPSIYEHWNPVHLVASPGHSLGDHYRAQVRAGLLKEMKRHG